MKIICQIQNTWCLSIKSRSEYYLHPYIFYQNSFFILNVLLTEAKAKALIHAFLAFQI